MKLILAGRPCAGKTTVAKYLASTKGLPVVNVGDALATAIAHKAGSSLSRSEIGHRFLCERPVEDIAEVLLTVAGDLSEAVIDGVRFVVTCRQLQSARKMDLWYVDAPHDIRLARLRQRLAQQSMSGETLARAIEEYEAFNDEQDELRKIAGVVVDNGGTIDELHRAIDNAQV